MSSTLHGIILLTSENFKGPIFWAVPRRCRRWGVSKTMHGWAFPYPEQILDRSLATPFYKKSLKKNLRLSMQPYFAIICSFIYEKYSTKYLSCGNTTLSAMNNHSIMTPIDITARERAWGRTRPVLGFAGRGVVWTGPGTPRSCRTGTAGTPWTCRVWPSSPAGNQRTES